MEDVANDNDSASETLEMKVILLFLASPSPLTVSRKES